MQENEFSSEKVFHAKPKCSANVIASCAGFVFCWGFFPVQTFVTNSILFTQLQCEKKICWKLHGKIQ